MKFTALFSPVPLAFLVFPFSYALQVLTQDEKFGLLGYALLLISAVSVLFKSALLRFKPATNGMRHLDRFVTVFLIFISLHIAIGVLTGGYTSSESARFFLIYVASGWVYFYVSRYAKEAEIKATIAAIGICGLIVGLHWVEETYSKMILQEVSDFQLAAIEYTKYRQDLGTDDLNLAGVGTVYRAYGLVENHTTTGATVAIGAFAMLACFPELRRRQRTLLLGLFLLILSVGLAMTAWISFVLLFPVVLALAEEGAKLLSILMHMALYIIALILLIVGLLLSTDETRALLTTIWDILGTQFGFLVNLDPASDEVSWFWLYVRHIDKYLDFAAANPLAFLVGEGPVGYGDVKYDRGGDVAYLELAAAYGFPMTVLFFVACISALARASRAVDRNSLAQSRRMFIVFGFAVLAFLLLSLLHYDTLLKKSIIISFYLALGLVRRYGYSSVTGRSQDYQPA